MVRDGYKFVMPLLALGLIAALARWQLICVVLLLLAAFVVYFFRDPQRVPPTDPSVVVSPADGRIMEVVEEPWEEHPGRRISIFLAIWNVHVNRAPMAGCFESLEYRPGRFYAAMRSRASAENEQNVIQLETQHGRIVFKQIAGWIARRVVCWKTVGDRVTLGERIGLIRFGSRMDLWLPKDAEITVQPGQHVSGGVSILARWP